MREILFRGKAINRDKGEFKTNYKNGDWVYGLFTRPYDKRFEMIPATMANTDGVTNIDIDYKTLGQYTGLTDKNGTKIFEGDIVKTDKFSEPNKKYIIKYDLQFGAFIGQDKYDCYFVTFDGYSDQFEIIGNVYDNPEFLRGEKQ